MSSKFIVTKEWIINNKTPRGAWMQEQIRALGWKDGIATKNWLKRSIGLEITMEQKEQFEQRAFDRPKEYIWKEKKVLGRKASKKRIDTKVPVVERQERQLFIEQSTPEFIASAEFLKTMEWKRARMDVIIRYGNSCMCCGSKPSDGIYLCVDHIKPRKTHPELALNLDNLQILCSDCNAGKGNDYNVSWRDYFVAKKIRTNK